MHAIKVLEFREVHVSQTIKGPYMNFIQGLLDRNRPSSLSDLHSSVYSTLDALISKNQFP